MFHNNDDFVIRLAAVFTLYLLHETQTAQPPVPIPMTPALWTEWQRFLSQLEATQTVDAYQIVYKMLMGGCFRFHAVIPFAQRLGLATRDSDARPVEVDKADALRNVVDLERLGTAERVYHESRMPLNVLELQSHVSSNFAESVQARLASAPNTCLERDRLV